MFIMSRWHIPSDVSTEKTREFRDAWEQLIEAAKGSCDLQGYSLFESEQSGRSIHLITMTSWPDKCTALKFERSSRWLRFVRTWASYKIAPDESLSTLSSDGIQMEVLGPRIQEIIRATCEHFEVSRNKLLAARRGGELVCLARHVAMWLSKKFTLKSFPDIGSQFHREHTSVMDGVARISNLLETGEIIKILRRPLAGDVDAIKAKLGIPSHSDHKPIL